MLIPGLGQLNHQLFFNFLQLAARQSQVRLGPVQKDVNEQTLFARHRADDVVLLAQCDQDVLNHVRNTQSPQGFKLGADHFNVASSGHFKIDA